MKNAFGFDNNDIYYLFFAALYLWPVRKDSILLCKTKCSLDNQIIIQHTNSIRIPSLPLSNIVHVLYAVLLYPL